MKHFILYEWLKWRLWLKTQIRALFIMFMYYICDFTVSVKYLSVYLSIAISETISDVSLCVLFFSTTCKRVCQMSKYLVTGEIFFFAQRPSYLFCTMIWWEFFCRIFFFLQFCGKRFLVCLFHRKL